MHLRQFNLLITKELKLNINKWRARHLTIIGIFLTASILTFLTAVFPSSSEGVIQ